MVDLIKTETKEKMEKSVESLKIHFKKIRTGRASIDMLDGIKVSYYGTPKPINQVGNISTPDAKTIVVQPWEKNLIGEIEKAILSSNLGITPQNDGNLIRLSVPSLTEERRKELAKECRTMSEDIKVAIRNIRKDSNEQIKKAEKNKELSEDLSKDAQDDIQKITDSYIAKVDELLAVKEKEVLNR
ncbi:MAG: ribosome recycling factor [Chitinispirillales bacterium]|nr:ribosome recycling factor [Chitinispirillales bacterium]